MNSRRIVLLEDIYFNDNYGRLYEKIEDGRFDKIEYEDENGRVSNRVIIRKVPFLIDEKQYYDMITPYGYGGPIVEWAKEDDATKKELIENFEKIAAKYCKENDIVSEFVRFHPIQKNYKDFEKIYDAKYMRKTLATSLKWDDPITEEFSKSCRKEIRRILKNNLKFEIEERPENLSEFKRIYNLNMERKHAVDYYFFDDSYYEDIINNLRDNVIVAKVFLRDKLIACGLYFISGKVIHAHLSGTDTDYLEYSPAYILKYGTVLWGKEHGYELIHYGGGLSNSEEDSLYRFKRRFAEKTDFDFYIGKKIWNIDIYSKLCLAAGVDENETFFPAYRASK